MKNPKSGYGIPVQMTPVCKNCSAPLKTILFIDSIEKNGSIKHPKKFIKRCTKCGLVQ